MICTAPPIAQVQFVNLFPLSLFLRYHSDRILTGSLDSADLNMGITIVRDSYKICIYPIFFETFRSCRETI